MEYRIRNMVLVQLLIFGLSFFSENSLLSNYQNQIDKQIIKMDLAVSKNTISYRNLSEQDLSFEYYEIKSNNEIVGYVFLKEVLACNLNGCSSGIDKNNELGSGKERFDLSVVTDTDFNIKNIKVLDYFSDYGYEICGKSYLNQYANQSICFLDNNDNSIDGISGATISITVLQSSLLEFCDVSKN